MKLTNKVAVVTGGAGGMGLATVLRFLQEGARVVVGDFNAHSGEATMAQIAQAGHAERACFLRGDVAIESDVKALVECALDRFGRLDVMFNNAGVGGAIGPVWDLEEDEWDYTFAVLVKGVFFGIKHATRALRRQQQGGAIINTASIAGLSGGGGPLVYSAAKAAVINMSRSAAVQLAPDRIRVNAICPGFILTGLTHRTKLSTEEAGRQLDALQPWPQHGTGADIAGAATFLASDDAAFVTGEALVVDGGLTALGPDLWQRFGLPYEATVSKSRVCHGTTGEGMSARPLKTE